MNEVQRRAALAAAVKSGSRPGGLARAALLVARGEYPHLDPTGTLAEVKRLAALVRDARTASGRKRSPSAALAHVLAVREGYRGAVEDYEDPENSYLNRVVERRRGLPILLSVLWIEVARAAGWKAHGVPFPGRFCVVLDPDGECVHLDPFEGGRRLSRDEVIGRLMLPDGSPLLEDLRMRATPRRTILRLLGNLTVSYERRGDAVRAERCYSDQIALDRTNLGTLVRRGDARRSLGDVRGALTDYNEVLHVLPPGAVYDTLREQARLLVRGVLSMN